MIGITSRLAILFGLVFLLFSSCEGQISFPPGGDTFVVLPGTDVTIAWTLNVRVPDLDVRTWKFLPKGSDTFAEIISDGDVENNTQYSPGPFTIRKPSTLILKNVNMQYNGSYRFSIVAKGQSSKSDVHVFVVKAAKANVTGITFEPNPAVVGEEVNITCDESKGVPEPSYTINHNGKQVSSEKTLVISEVKRSDEGPYTCVAQNKLGNDSATANFTVVAKPNITGITFAPNPAVVGEEVTITCDESEGVPEPSYTINHNDKQVSSEKTFTISEVKQSDEGPYTCVAQNKLGNDSATADLTVTEARSTPKPPLTSTSNGQDNGEGSTTRPCNFIPRIQPQIKMMVMVWALAQLLE